MREEKQDIVATRNNGQVNFPNLETRAEKLARKRKFREQFYQENYGRGLVMANLSKNHMDYGMSPAEHLRAKQERENNS